MTILLLGSGGREHALAWKMIQSLHCSKLYVAPGNAGTDTIATNVDLNPNDFDRLKLFCIENQVDMVVVGPEDPLVNGIYDYFKQDLELKNIPVIGPSQEGAQLEGSKEYAKQRVAQMDTAMNMVNVSPGNPYDFENAANPFMNLLNNRKNLYDTSKEM